MGYDNNQTVDKAFIKIRQNKNKSLYNKNDNDTNKDFCYKMYNDWTRKDSPVDIPILIMDNDNLIKNKDIDIIPRLYSKYAQRNIHIPFIFKHNKSKYVTFRKYFRNILNKDIPNSHDFKQMLIEKKDFEKNADLFECVNIFLYTSFLLKQFSPVMNMVPHFYSPISDETKYYFYIVFDYLRRECIKTNRPLMKNEVIRLIEKVYSLNNKELTKNLFLNTFSYIDETIFDSYTSFNLITENKIFHYTYSVNENNENNNHDKKKVFKNKHFKNEEFIEKDNININIIIENINNIINPVYKLQLVSNKISN